MGKKNQAWLVQCHMCHMSSIAIVLNYNLPLKNALLYLLPTCILKKLNIELPVRILPQQNASSVFRYLFQQINLAFTCWFFTFFFFFSHLQISLPYPIVRWSMTSTWKKMSVVTKCYHSGVSTLLYCLTSSYLGVRISGKREECEISALWCVIYALTTRLFPFSQKEEKGC